jgi:hypothetical protein
MKPRTLVRERVTQLLLVTFKIELVLSVILFQVKSILLKYQREVFNFYKSFHYISFLLLPIKTAYSYFLLYSHTIFFAFLLLFIYYYFIEIIIIMLFYKQNKIIKKYNRLQKFDS